MTFLHKILAKKKPKSVLNWAGYDGEDFDDAVDHCAVIRRRQMSKPLDGLKEEDEKSVEPEKILPKESFKSKEKGWLLKLPEDQWVDEFRKVYGRDVTKILELSRGEGVPAVIVLDGMLGDGFARTQLAYGLNEKVNVVYFVPSEDEDED